MTPKEKKEQLEQMFATLDEAIEFVYRVINEPDTSDVQYWEQVLKEFQG